MTRWLDPEPLEIPDSFVRLGLHPLVAQTLVRRGINSAGEAEKFLHPHRYPSSPFPGIEKPVELLLSAIRSEGRICVWGDFDVDGQTSTALLVQTLRSLGAHCSHYIPVRAREGHGVHIDSLKPLLDGGIRLILTCDTGITAHEAVAYARGRGADVIVTDHHDPPESLPNANALVNPKLLSPDSPLGNLAGVGVAFKLAEALIQAGPRTETHLSAQALLDLVALGLIADVALLRGETRSLAHQGLHALRRTSRPGLKAIADLSGTDLETLTEETIGFTFAPRLNALGRLGDANPAVDLLLTQDPARARVLAAQIEGLNAQRRLLTSQVFEAAEAQLRQQPELLHEPAIVLSHPDWPGGVVGIVANRLVDRYHKPALLLTESEDGRLHGSARSVEGLHITAAIEANAALLFGFGGHPMAAGLSLPRENLPEFRKGLGRAIVEQLGGSIREESTLQIDAWLGLGEVEPGLAQSLEALAPFGPGNPPLTFATRSVVLKSIKEIGKTREHRRMVIADESGTEQDLLWWNGAGEEIPEAGAKFDIAYSLRQSTYRGRRQVTLQFEEFRLLGETPAEVRPQRIDLRDLRLQPAAAGLGPATLIWAEGEEKSRGRSRFELYPADEFAVYTTPPSPADLRLALEIVRPKTVFVIAVPPAEEKADGFLNRLAGLCKYALNQRGGTASLKDLSAAMAARERAVHIGLEWLAAGNHLSVVVDDDRVFLSPAANDRDPGAKNPYLQAELFIALRGILNETAAFRKYFATADLRSLIGSDS